MAHIYHIAKVHIDRTDVSIRPLDEEDYHVAITFPDSDDEDVVTEVLLTRDEVREAYDLLFNR